MTLSAQFTPCSFSQARQQLQTALQCITATEIVTVGTALERFCAENIHAPVNVPAFDNAAMDGYAFRAQDLNNHDELTLVGTALAGHAFEAPLKPGQALRITTGAPMPAGCDSVLPLEQAVLENSTTLNMRQIPIHAGQHRRCCGEDLTIGTTAIEKGRRLGPAELGLLAALGMSEILVQKRLRVAIFSTGDELNVAGHELGSGQIYDSNRITLHAMLTRLGAEITDLGVLSDDPETLTETLRLSAPQVDVILTSGGVSAGAADFTRQAFQRLGDMHFLAIQMRPGKPLAFGRIPHLTGNTYVFGLPGNPVAMMMSFIFLVRPALQLLAGAQFTPVPLIQAKATEAIYKKTGRTEFQRGNYDFQQCQVTPTDKQGSAMLTSMVQANCILVLPDEQTNIVPGDTISVVLMQGFV